MCSIAATRARQQLTRHRHVGCFTHPLLDGPINCKPIRTHPVHRTKIHLSHCRRWWVTAVMHSVSSSPMVEIDQSPDRVRDRYRAQVTWVARQPYEQSNSTSHMTESLKRLQRLQHKVRVDRRMVEFDR